MVDFPLQIVTPDGLVYDGQAGMVHLRTIDGNVGIRARHIDFVTALGMGECRVDIDENTTRRAACMGGLVAVTGGRVRIVATTFEWAEELDRPRAEAAKEQAEQMLAAAKTKEEKKYAEARLRRALVRLGVLQHLTHSDIIGG